MWACRPPRRPLRAPGEVQTCDRGSAVSPGLRAMSRPCLPSAPAVMFPPGLTLPRGCGCGLTARPRGHEQLVRPAAQFRPRPGARDLPRTGGMRRCAGCPGVSPLPRSCPQAGVEAASCELTGLILRQRRHLAAGSMQSPRAGGARRRWQRQVGMGGTLRSALNRAAPCHPPPLPRPDWHERSRGQERQALSHRLGSGTDPQARAAAVQPRAALLAPGAQRRSGMLSAAGAGRCAARRT